jgi:hypothetical protein
MDDIQKLIKKARGGASITTVLDILEKINNKLINIERQINPHSVLHKTCLENKIQPD